MAPPARQPLETVHRADDFVTIDRTTKIFSGDGRCKQNPSGGNFNGSYPFAVKIATGRINAIALEGAKKLADLKTV